MRLFLYYAFCSVKNQIRRLFRTWVAVFILVCFLFGAVIGVGVVLLDEKFGEDVPDEEITEDETIEDEVIEDEPLFDESFTREDMLSVVELAVGGIVLVVLLLGVFNADKGGSSIFLMADVNLLFAAAPISSSCAKEGRLRNR